VTPKALEGLRVLEYGSFIAAPFAARLMADLGAMVIKIEPPQGDRARRYGPFPGDAPSDEASGLFLHINAGKRAVTLDVEAPSGQRLLQALLAWADLFIEHSEPGSLEALGLAPAQLCAANPRLVVTSVRPFGMRGRHSRYRGDDMVTWHASGAGQGYLGDPDREPLRGAWHFNDHFAGICAATASLLALHAREATGQGQHIDIAAADLMAMLCAGPTRIGVYHYVGAYLSRQGKLHAGGAPAALLPCKDGFVYIHAYERHQWEGVVKAMGDPDWAKEPMFSGSFMERGQYRDEMYALMSDWLMSRTKAEVFEAFQRHRAPCAPLNTMGDLLFDSNFRERGFFKQLEHPVTGEITLPGAPYRLSATPWRLERPAPLLGQDNEAVYCGLLGLSHAELADLHRAGVV
jgi:crotonobetainyl-CoA:carnitine CoA-transferase CaiB-like acyl-CoA transferase